MTTQCDEYFVLCQTAHGKRYWREAGDPDLVDDRVRVFGPYMCGPGGYSSAREGFENDPRAAEITLLPEGGWVDEETAVHLTVDHAASSYGIPVVVGPDGQVMDYDQGLRAIRRERGMSVAQIADVAGVSARTVEGWEQGRMPSTEALLRLMHTL